MDKQLFLAVCMVLLCVGVLHAQQATDAPFAAVERAVKQEQGGWAGDKSRLSTVFAAERERLGERFEAELLKWLGNDPEKHYWVSEFLEDEGYLHGSKHLPHLSLLVKQQGIALVQRKDDDESRGYLVGLSITAAILSDEMGLHALASSYKTEAERLLLDHANLSAYVPAVSVAERRRYDEIKSTASRNSPVIIGDVNPHPVAKVSAGVVNGRAIKMVPPTYPAAARRAGASGTVAVQIVFDESGNVVWAKAVSGHPLLQKVTEDAAWQAKFTPTRLSGQLVKTSGILVYNFVAP